LIRKEMDFTFSNSNIKDWFEDRSTNAPVSELVYLHEHPLVTPNFVTEIAELVRQAADVIVKKNMKGHPVEQLEKAAIKIGQALPTVDYNSAPVILDGLKQLYKLCNRLIGKLGPE
jgi:hypothetical protein